MDPVSDELCRALREALRAAGSPWADAAIDSLPDLGLAHRHLRLAGTGVLARVPKQSQMDLPAAANLAYQAACFERAAASGHTPSLHGVLPPSTGLPRGALLVEEIVGRPARLPQDLQSIVDALAAIHALPMPAQRSPLLDPADPLALLHGEIEAQALHLDAAGLETHSRRAIDARLADFAALCAAEPRPAKRLIAFDAHPGNFILRETDGRAVLVDLEKARYSHPPLDLAHATLYTSTTWDRASAAELDAATVAAACERWLAASDDGQTWHRWLLPLRAAMWLWSITWCAKWRVLSAAEAGHGADGEDWSAQRSEAALVAHVRERVDHYLSPQGIERAMDEFAALRARGL